jgi:hypothetical protein
MSSHTPHKTAESGASAAKPQAPVPLSGGIWQQEELTTVLQETCPANVYGRPCKYRDCSFKYHVCHLFDKASELLQTQEHVLTGAGPMRK